MEDFMREYVVDNGKIECKVNGTKVPTFYETLKKIVEEKFDSIKNDLVTRFTEEMYAEVMKEWAKSTRISFSDEQPNHLCKKGGPCKCESALGVDKSTKKNKKHRQVIGFECNDGKSLSLEFDENGKMFLVNDCGELIVKDPITGYEYSSQSDFLLVRRYDGKYAFINKYGILATEWLDQAYQFKNGKAKVIRNGDTYDLFVADKDTNRLSYSLSGGCPAKDEHSDNKKDMSKDKDKVFIDFKDVLDCFGDIFWPVC